MFTPRDLVCKTTRLTKEMGSMHITMHSSWGRLLVFFTSAKFVLACSASSYQQAALQNIHGLPTHR